VYSDWFKNDKPRKEHLPGRYENCSKEDLIQRIEILEKKNEEQDNELLTIKRRSFFRAVLTHYRYAEYSLTFYQIPRFKQNYTTPGEFFHDLSQVAENEHSKAPISRDLDDLLGLRDLCDAVDDRLFKFGAFPVYSTSKATSELNPDHHPLPRFDSDEFIPQLLNQTNILCAGAPAAYEFALRKMVKRIVITKQPKKRKPNR